MRCVSVYYYCNHLTWNNYFNIFATLFKGWSKQNFPYTWIQANTGKEVTTEFVYAASNSVKAILETEIEFQYQQKFVRDVSLIWSILTMGQATQFYYSEVDEKITSGQFIMTVSCLQDTIRRAESINFSVTEAEKFLVLNILVKYTFFECVDVFKTVKI